MGEDISWWKDLVELAQALVVSIGILIGGLWTYLLFVRKRLAYPRADLELSVSHLPVVGQVLRLVHVVVSIKNAGDVLLRSNNAELCLRQVVPLPESLSNIAEGGFDPVPQGQTEIEWPLFAGREWRWDKHAFEIEPGESDCLHADFIIPVSMSVVEFYFFVTNSRKKRDHVGWTCTELYAFDKNSVEVTEMVHEKESSKSRLNEQQRQQKKQTSQQQQQHKQGDQSKGK